mmetsp:Transcript_48986/g.91160  ORF Transcript_48986/g.91160 Transcript_48986/m.91160 type:complete len:312 (+) Transcript_48986:721-1656(+)
MQLGRTFAASAKHPGCMGSLMSQTITFAPASKYPSLGFKCKHLCIFNRGYSSFRQQAHQQHPRTTQQKRARIALLSSLKDQGSEDTNLLEEELLGLIGDGSLDAVSKTGRSRTETNRRVEDLVQELQQRNPTVEPNTCADLPGRWRLLSSFKPGSATVNFFSLSDWNNYLFNGGPSPVQNLVVGNTRTVSRVYQVLDLAPANRFLNVVDFSKESGGVLVIAARITELDGPSNIKFRFSNGFFLFKRVFGRELDPPVKVIYPVPFGLLGDRAKGGLNTTYLNKDLRISVGSKGTVFVLKREEENDSVSLVGY